ncbi:hypothetical protein AB1339_15775 [Streptomyces cyaneofuscatus]|uniref:hypothetical protein n=1 Tax=Streptomyces cyaneofuscatus TaxID=66883 RepID=UPI00345DE5C6
MARIARLTGSSFIRPARLGIAFNPNLDNIRRAASSATRAWGGIYFPFLDSTDKDASLRIAERFDLDAIWALDGAENSEELAKSVGFFWRSFGDNGPFGEPEDPLLPSALLSPDWALSEDGSGPFTLPKWEEDNPLAALYSVWFGSYQTASSLHSRFRMKATEHSLVSEARIPSGVINFRTPIAATQLGIKFNGPEDRVGIARVDANNASSLLHFWNLRASGATVFPWVDKHEDTLLPLLKDWYAKNLRSAPTGVSQDGATRIMSLWRMTKPPTNLADVTQQWPCEWQVESSALHLGWRGHNALDTPFTRTFSVQIDPTEGKASIPLPPGPPTRYVANNNAGIVAAQVSIYTETGLRPGVVAAAPSLRKYSRLIDTMGNFPGSFDRVVHEGRAVGVAADAHEVEIGFTTSLALFRQLFADTAWKVKHTEGGQLTSRIIETLGGVKNYPGNQPAIRRVLDDAARSTSGKKIPTLINAARNYQRDWPGLGYRTSGDYPKNTVYGLLHKKLLQPFLELKCPHCATRTPARPEELANEMECEICSEKYPLGFALGVTPGGKNEWVYRLAGNLSVDRVSEIMPVAATQAVLADILGRGGSSVPHVYGVKLEQGKWSCEIDVVALADAAHEQPLVVLGEVKSYRDSIDRNDLDNLVKVQSFLESEGIACLILAATLRDKFSDSEISDLRDICESLDSQGSRLPIVLTGTQLSVPPRHPDYPASWDSRFRISHLARESCQRNLGLIDGASPRGCSWAAEWQQSR